MRAEAAGRWEGRLSSANITRKCSRRSELARADSNARARRS